MFHAHGLGNALLASVASGATLVLTEAFDRRGTLDLIRSERVTFFPGVPLMFSALTAVRQSIAEDQRTLRTCFSAGAPLSPEISSKFESKFGVPVRQLYGCSEAGSVTMNLDKDPHIVSGSVGRPTGWGEVRVLDEFGDDQPPGTPGRIAISTPTLTAAYDGMPEATASAFHGRWFITGDLGYLDQRGNLYITGREKVFISTGGFKVDPVEVENVLTAHPLVREAVVLGIPQQSGDELVKAVVVGEPELTREGLVAHCKANLATFKVPRTIEFREEMPRNAVGKVLKKYLM
jgi:long-chain acyl-CoA synthetase